MVCVSFRRIFQGFPEFNLIFLSNSQKGDLVVFDSYMGKTNSIFNDFKHLPVLHLISTT